MYSTAYTWQVRAGNGVNLKEADAGTWRSFTVMGLPNITVSPSTTEIGEGSGRTAQFTVKRAGTWDVPVTVNLAFGGSADNGIDYQPLTTPVTIPAGSNRSAVLTLTPINDTIAEGDEIVIVAVLPGAGYAVGRPSTATVTIVDDDLSTQDIDLVVASLTAPASVGAGQSIAITDTTRNQGTVAAAEPLGDTVLPVGGHDAERR